MPLTIGFVWAVEAPCSGRLEYTSIVDPLLVLALALPVLVLLLLLLLPHAAIPSAAVASRHPITPFRDTSSLLSMMAPRAHRTT
jgi:hypothetical protein